MTALLIAGFHRSGTSAVARLLHDAGLDLGAQLLGAEPANPYGHFEDLDVITLHDDALSAQDLTWKSTASLRRPLTIAQHAIDAYASGRSATHALWGVKDPRLCLFLPEWTAAVPDARILVVKREPGACVDSLHRRHARRYVDTRRIDPSDILFWQQPDLGLELWIHYYEQLLAHLPSPDLVHVVDFADRQAVEALPTTLNSRWNLRLNAEDSRGLDPTLGARHVAVEVRQSSNIERANDVWNRLAG